MKKHRTISITNMVLLAVAVFAIISVSFYLLVIRTTINDIFFTEAYEENEEIAQSAVDFFESNINHQIDTIISIEVAHHNILGQENELFSDQYYETMISNSEYITSLEILNLNRDIIYSSKELQNREGINISNYYLFQDLTTIHSLAIGNLVYDTQNNELALEVAYRGEDVIVSGLISIDFFRLYGEEFKASFDNKELMILGGNGKFLYDSYNSEHLIQAIYYDFDSLTESVSSDQLSTFEINDKESIVSMVQMGINDWRIVIYETRASALRTNQLSLNYFTLTTLGVLIILLAVFGYVIYQMMRDVRIILQRMDAVSEGDFGDDLQTSKVTELNRLRTGYNQMKTRIQQSTERLEYLAFHDDLTSLPTKNKARDDFKTFMKQSKVTFCYIDINRFEIINDNYGYDFGDHVLVHITSTLRPCFDHLYRVQSDEFLGLIFDQTKDSVMDQLEPIMQELQSGILLEGLRIPVSLRIGLARYPNHGDEFDELLQKAIIASHEIKSNDGFGMLCYDDSKSDLYIRQSQIELSLSNALEHNDFTTVYQPIVNMKDGTIRGFEALSRWTHHELGVVRPDEFVPLLERNHTIGLLDEFVLNNSLRLNKFLSDEYGLHLVSSVNVSVESIMKPDFTDVIDSALERFKINPKYLEIEITESTIIQDFEGISNKIQYLRRKGVKFSEDDFGDAYSSLTYLTRLDIDTLKISKNFLSSILTNVESRILIQTIIELAHRLGFFTVVEGIEDQNTYDLFQNYGCDYVQGYLLYKPMPEEALITLLQKRSKEE